MHAESCTQTADAMALQARGSQLPTKKRLAAGPEHQVLGQAASSKALVAERYGLTCGWLLQPDLPRHVHLQPKCRLPAPCLLVNVLWHVKLWLSAACHTGSVQRTLARL